MECKPNAVDLLRWKETIMAAMILIGLTNKRLTRSYPICKMLLTGDSSRSSKLQ
jgi:hypothetical protein